mgnify:CR=1 FL=1
MLIMVSGRLWIALVTIIGICHMAFSRRLDISSDQICGVRANREQGMGDQLLGNCLPRGINEISLLNVVVVNIVRQCQLRLMAKLSLYLPMSYLRWFRLGRLFFGLPPLW